MELSGFYRVFSFPSADCAITLINEIITDWGAEHSGLWWMFLYFLRDADVGDAWRNARGSDQPQVRYEQQQSTDNAATSPISSYQHRP